MPRKRPNILLITADQLRRDALGCCGNDVIDTPNLDNLASGGVNFKNAFTPSPICVPARASITTGCYPHRCTGTKNNAGRIKKGFPLLGEELSKRGYGTYALGKLHYLPYAPPGKKRTTYGIETVELAESGRILRMYDPEGKMRGLEDYHDYLYTVGWGGYERAHGLGNNDIFPSASPVPSEYYVDTWVADRALHYMEQHLDREPGKPFFMWVSFPKPHSAYDPPRPYDAMYDPRDMPLPAGSPDMLRQRGLAYLAAREDAYIWDTFSPEARNVIKAHYYGLVTHQDGQVGRLAEFLVSRRIENDTVVIYTSDHGDMLGDFGLYFKTCFYSGSAGVPLILRYPGVFEAGKMPDEPAGLQDVLPTLLELSGGAIAPDMDGVSLLDAAEGRSGREYFVSQCHEHPIQQYMVAGKEWKYIYHQAGGIEELYNLDDDPQELKNLALSGSAESEAELRRAREYLIWWCLEKRDGAMVKGGVLAESPAGTPVKSEPMKLPFGRRFY